MRIARTTTREQLAAIVVRKLGGHGIDAVLVGGSVVSIYTHNRYESRDLDFISPADPRRIVTALAELGFAAKGKDFSHADTRFTVEFPSGPLAIGSDLPVQPEGRMIVAGVEIKLLSPTQCVMDRLSAFFWWNDRQCLDQAVWVAESQPVDLDRVSAWAERERETEKLLAFLKRVRR